MLKGCLSLMQTSLYLDRKALVTVEERQLWVVEKSPARQQGPGFQWEARGGTCPTLSLIHLQNGG